MARGEADLVKPRAPALQLAVLVGVVALGHLSLIPNVADLDGFYHIGHAQAYLEGSLFDTSLPWATRSVIGDIGGDLWWGFHVLLLPFAALGSVPLGLQSAGVALTAVLGLSVMRILMRHGVDHAGWWAALFLLAVPNVFFRHLMVRPHVISLAASLALASMLVRGRWWQVMLLSALIAWVHLSLFWVAPLLAVAYALARIPVTVLVGRETPDTGVPIHQAIPAVCAGVLLGWLLRPDALATAELLNVQLVQLFTQKMVEQPLTFAAELSPIRLSDLARSTWSFLAAWLVGVALVGRSVVRGEVQRLGQSRATLLVLCVVVSTAFLGLALLSARRALEQWVAFGFLALPLLAPLWRGSTGESDEAEWAAEGGIAGVRRLMTPVRGVLALLLGVHLLWFGQRHLLNKALVSFSAVTLEPVAEYLIEHSEPNDLVFHARWDNFGPLFAFNRQSRYLGGMDPIFQYAHDARSYWEFFYLSADATTEWTCDAYPCAAGNATDTYQVLTEHFGAQWIVVQPYRNPLLSLYLLNDDRYEVAFETQSDALFRILP
jgi:hypothetical protein